MTERKIALSIEEAADYTGIGRNTLRKLVEWKKLPVLKVGRKVLIKTDILEKFMEANEGRDLRDKGNVKAVTRNVATYDDRKCLLNRCSGCCDILDDDNLIAILYRTSKEYSLVAVILYLFSV